MDRSYLSWPFFTEHHRALQAAVDAFARTRIRADEPEPADEAALDARCRELVTALGEAGLLQHAVPSAEHTDAGLDVRSLCLIRETLAYHDALADFAFAMQGLGSGPVSLFGSPEQKARYLPKVAAGQQIAAFALSEENAGSDAAALETRALRDGDGYVLEGEKLWISNGGIADFYVVFARTDPDAPAGKGVSAFIVEAGDAGLEIAERIPVIAPHPLARLRFRNLRLGPERLVGRPGEGFKVALATLDVFRSTVGAAALGMARRALDAALARAQSRRMFGGLMQDLPLAQEMLAEMALEIDAAALLVYRAAWTKDEGAARVTREAAMAKLYATEAAQRVIDRAVQLHGGLGVRRGTVPERLYREIRALRIYEGASEVQRLVIARETLKAARA
ncbi:MAG: acyl-CoA dehydrogenase, partial [Alphaproteobacteria bacterium]